MCITKRLMLAIYVTVIFSYLPRLCFAREHSKKEAPKANGDAKESEKKTSPSQTESAKPKEFDYYKIIMDRDIFRRDFSRQPPKPGPTPEEMRRRREREMNAAPRKDDRVLIGIFYIEGKDLALVEGGGSSDFLAAGASIRGNGKIEKIEPMQVVVRYGDETLKIRIGQTLAGGKPSYRSSYSTSTPALERSEGTTPSSTNASTAPPSAATSSSVVKFDATATPAATTSAPSATSTPGASMPTSRPPGMSVKDWMLLRRRQQLQKK